MEARPPDPFNRFHVTAKSPQECSNTLPEQFGPPSADRFREPGVAKLLAGSVHRLGDAIGVEAQRVNSDTRAV